MSNIVFALPRTEYGSYSDLYRLIELNGYATCYLDEIDPDSTNCYIMTVANGENAVGWTDPRANIILYDFEHRMDTYPFIPGCAAYWHMDAAQARRHGVRYVPLGGDRRLMLETPGKPDADYHVAYMAYMTWRRQVIEGQLRARELRIAGNAWGQARHEKLRKSTAYLHVHQLDDAPGVPALRMVVAAAYRLPVITETFADPGIFMDMTLEAPFHELAEATATWTMRYAHIEEYGTALYQMLCEEYTFRRGIEGHV